MAWIESHQSLGSHPKTKKLCRLLRISKLEAIGGLHMLWWWAMDYAETGDLTRFDALDIAIGAEWEGDEQQFIDALVTAGFLDRDEDGLRIHDWHDYAGKLIERRARNAQRMRDARADDDHARDDTTEPRASHVQGTQRARVQLPNQTKPNQPNPTEPDQPTNNEAPQAASVPKPKPKRSGVKVQFPDDFEVTDRMRQWAKDTHDLTDEQIEAKTDRFRRWALKTGTKYIRWDIAWQDSMEWEDRNAAKSGMALVKEPIPIRTGGAAKGGMTPAEIREYGRRRAAQEAGGQ